MTRTVRITEYDLKVFVEDTEEIKDVTLRVFDTKKASLDDAAKECGYKILKIKRSTLGEEVLKMDDCNFIINTYYGGPINRVNNTVYEEVKE